MSGVAGRSGRKMFVPTPQQRNTDARADAATLWTGSQKLHFARDGVVRPLGLPQKNNQAVARACPLWAISAPAFGRTSISRVRLVKADGARRECMHSDLLARKAARQAIETRAKPITAGSSRRVRKPARP